MPRKPQKNIRVVIITGLSGSGKSTALKAFEDIGFFCIDNLPATLLPRFLDLKDEISKEVLKIAIGMDLRGKDFLTRFPEIYQDLKRRGYSIEVLYLDASDEVLARRFSQTRRQHPLGEEKTLAGNIQLERRKMDPIRKLATYSLDSTSLNVHQLRDEVQRLFSQIATPPSMLIHLVSFGYKYGLPFDADLVMDVRFLPNPFFVSELKDLDGNRDEVVHYVLKGQETKTFLREFLRLIAFLVPAYQKEGKSNLTIAVGCTGGRHRSVVIVNALADYFKEREWAANVKHRDIEMG